MNGNLVFSLDNYSDDKNDKVIFHGLNMKELREGFIPASATGRGISLRIEDQGRTGDPYIPRDTVRSDTYTTAEKRQVCERSGCREQIEFVTGRRRRIRSEYNSREWLITLASPKGEKLVELKVENGESDEDTDYGECRSDHDYGHRRHR